MPMEDGTEKPLYVLQRININVFKEPGKVMENIFGVTEFLRDVIRREGGDPDRETLAYIKTKSGRHILRMMKVSHGAVRILSPILYAIRWWSVRSSFTSQPEALVIF